MESAEKLGFEHQDKSSLVVFASRKAMRELAVMQIHCCLANFCAPAVRADREDGLGASFAVSEKLATGENSPENWSREKPPTRVVYHISRRQ